MSRVTRMIASITWSYRTIPSKSLRIIRVFVRSICSGKAPKDCLRMSGTFLPVGLLILLDGMDFKMSLPRNRAFFGAKDCVFRRRLRLVRIGEGIRYLLLILMDVSELGMIRIKIILFWGRSLSMRLFSCLMILGLLLFLHRSRGWFIDWFRLWWISLLDQKFSLEFSAMLQLLIIFVIWFLMRCISWILNVRKVDGLMPVKI